MSNTELEQIRSKLTHKQKLYLNALISNKSEPEARRLAGYAKAPKSKPLKEAIELIHKQDFNKALSERQKAIKFHLENIDDLKKLYSKVDYKNIKLDPLAILREQRNSQVEISKLKGLYIEPEEEKEEYSDEEKKEIRKSILSLTD